MKGSIKRSIGLTHAGISFFFVLLSFVVTIFIISKIGSYYQQNISNMTLEYATSCIDPDEAKEIFTTRSRNDAYETVKNKLINYQQSNGAIIDRISLVSFSNSTGVFIYDSAGASLGDRLEYADYTASIKAELINGRNAFTHIENGRMTAYRPIRTVDDKLAGYLVVSLKKPFERTYFPYIIAFFCGVMLVSFLGSFLIVKFLDRRFFIPIRKITKTAVYLSGDDSALEGQDASVMFDTKRTDEIGRLSTALQNIFFNMNSDAKHLSQAIYDANHDGMTKHLNKRCYHSMIETFRKLDSICVIYFDVNNLKLMNDTLGHENGDRVITRAADYIRSFMTENDYCFRMGGDEFLLVMTNCSFRAADKVIEKIESDAPYLLSREDDSVRCALAYGCAFAKGEYDYDALLTEAEENMYEKKSELKALWQMPDR